MAFASGRSINSSDNPRSARATRVSSRSDLFPRLVAMQKLADAQNFAVYRMSGSGLPAKQRLICELENWGPSNASLNKAFADAYGDALIEHIEKSLLPLAWAGSHDRSFPSAVGIAPFLVRLQDGLVPFSGMAFPVRLGAIGNGFVVFTGDDLDPPNEWWLSCMAAPAR
jgi:hypothetical protein